MSIKKVMKETNILVCDFCGKEDVHRTCDICGRHFCFDLTCHPTDYDHHEYEDLMCDYNGTICKECNDKFKLNYRDELAKLVSIIHNSEKAVNALADQFKKGLDRELLFEYDEQEVAEPFPKWLKERIQTGINFATANKHVHERYGYMKRTLEWVLSLKPEDKIMMETLIKCRDCDELGVNSKGIYRCTRTGKFILSFNLDDTPLKCPKRSDEL